MFKCINGKASYLCARKPYIKIKNSQLLSSPGKINKKSVSGKDNGLSSVARTEKVNKVVSCTNMPIIISIWDQGIAGYI